MARKVDSGSADSASFWAVSGDVAMLDKASRGAMRFFSDSGWKPVPAYAIEEDGVEITEADFDARLLAAKEALKDGG